MIKVKRVQDKKSRQDGVRILVERLWPRGVRKEDAAVDLWLKDLAPSTELRKWFGHDPDKWEEFKKRYWRELEKQGDLLALLDYRAREGAVTFLYSARDEEHNSAIALKAFLEENRK